MQIQSSSAKMREFIFFNLTRGASVFVLVILFAIFAALVYYSLPAISKFGIYFLVSSDWDVVKEQFGGAASIYGSIISTVIAMILATPVAIGIAIF